MPPRHIHLPYEPCVGVVLINRSGLVWARQWAHDCMRPGTAGGWELPQGRMAPDEPVREAALRVLEPDFDAATIRMLAEAPGWFSYELPTHLIGVALGGEFFGQKQKWVAMQLRDDAEGLGTANGTRRWMAAATVVRLAPVLKQQLYEDVITTFAPFLPPFTGEPDGRPAAVSVPWFVSLFG